MKLGLALGALVALTIVVRAQDQQPRPVFKTGVELVHLDVSVLDKDRKPVRGLTAADFTVKEDGKPQSIANFVAIDVPPKAPAPGASWIREVSPDTVTNETVSSPEGRLFVLLIDDAMIPPDPAMIANAKKIGRGVIDRLSPYDRVAVVFTYASKNAQDFTTDRKKLLTAIDSLTVGPASHMLGWETPVPSGTAPGSPLVPAGDNDIQLRQGSMATMRLSAETLIAAPQRRKSLIYISPGLTVDVVSDAQIVRARAGSASGLAVREANHRLVTDMPEVFRRLQRANVTVYSIDPCGLGGFETWVAAKARGLSALRSATLPVPADYKVVTPKDAADRTPAELAILRSLSESGAGPVAEGALPLSVTLAPVAVAGTTTAGTTAVTIVVGARQDAVTTRTPQSIELQVSVFTPDGIAVGRPQRQTATLTLLPDGRPEKRYELVTQVPDQRARTLHAAHCCASCHRHCSRQCVCRRGSTGLCEGAAVHVRRLARNQPRSSHRPSRWPAVARSVLTNVQPDLHA